MSNSGYKDQTLSTDLDVLDAYVDRRYVLNNYAKLFPNTKIAGLWVWGRNTYGQLGNNDGTTHASTPIQTCAGGTDWIQSNAADNHSMGLKSDGTLWLWGNNGSGQLGDNTTVRKSSPVQTIFGGTWKNAFAGGSSAGSYTMAIKTDGTLWGWGDGGDGKTGLLITGDRNSPVQVTVGGTDWERVSGGWFSTGAIKTDGTLWMCGRGSSGELGDGTTASKSSLIQVGSDTNWRDVTIGRTYTLGLKTDGTMWAWGNGTYGKLGLNKTSNVNSPEQIGSATDWKQVSAGQYHAVAVNRAGELWTWGYGATGRLGHLATSSASTPIQTTAGGPYWRACSAGGRHSLGIKTDGTIWLWGENATGQLGQNSIADASSPVQVITDGNHWRSGFAAFDHTLVIVDHSE